MEYEIQFEFDETEKALIKLAGELKQIRLIPWQEAYTKLIKKKNYLSYEEFCIIERELLQDFDRIHREYSSVITPLYLRAKFSFVYKKGDHETSGLR